jgi:hypothetical protein
MIVPPARIAREIPPLQLVLLKIIDIVPVVVKPCHQFVNMPDNHPGTGYEKVIFTTVRFGDCVRHRPHYYIRQIVGPEESVDIVDIRAAIFNQEIFVRVDRNHQYLVEIGVEFRGQNLDVVDRSCFYDIYSE